MSATGATGPASNDGNVAAAAAGILTDPTDSEIQESRRQAALRAARLGVPAKKANGAAPATPSSGDTLAAPAKQRQAEGVERVTPPAEKLRAQKVVPDAAIGGSDPAKNEADFLARVVPWPAHGAPGVINMHWTFPKGKGMGGRAFSTLVDFMKFVATARNRPASIKDIYFCLSAQEKTGPKRNGLATAYRNRDNISGLKAVWLDLDVKASGYKTTNEALEALFAFCQSTGYPRPSALVYSGSGGLHVYWISDRTLTLDEWRPYAEGLRALGIKFGLKADYGCTIDAVRVLRVPGTFNHKTTPAKEVKLLSLGNGKDINFQAELSKFSVAVAPTPKKQADPLLYDPVAFPKRPPSPMLNDPEYLQRSGIIEEKPPISAQPMLERCPMMAQALKTGGADADQGLWMLQVLATTFCHDGREIAHKISRGYTTYSEDETNRMYDRKDQEREERGLGWPACSTFKSFGSKECAACPHKGNIRSPLNLGTPLPVTRPAQANNSSTNGPWPHWPDPLDFHQVSETEAIARVNAAGYFVLTVNGDIYKIEAGGGVVAQKREGFNNLFACRQACLDNGDLISAGAAWKNSSDRREYDRIGYWPSDHGRPPKSYNLWRGWGIEPKQGDCSIIYEHILHVIADGDKGKANYVLDWSAHMLQRPWEKPGVALVLKGRKGTGKTLLTLLLARVIGGQNTIITANGKKLFDTFNWFLADKLLIGAEEAFFAGNRGLNDQLKHLLTGEDIEVEQKFGQRISMQSMHRVIMTSNHDQVVAASDDERRFFVCDVSDKRRGDDAYFAPLVRVIKGEDDATLAAFMYELQTRDIKNWKPEQAARKAAGSDLARQKLLNLEPPLQWLLETETAAPAVSAPQIVEDTGKPEDADVKMDRCIQRLTAETVEEAKMAPEEQDASWRKRTRNDMLRGYRDWAKTAQVRGATDFTGGEIFWASVRRLLNKEIFPGRRLFRASGGNRFVLLPPPQELVDGFDRLLGAKVVDVDEEFSEQVREQVQ